MLCFGRLKASVMMTMLSVSRSFNRTFHPNNRGSRTRAWAAPLSDAQRENVLMEWVEGRGGRVGPVAVCRSEQEGWFLQTTTDLSPGVKLISLPNSCQLTYDAADDPVLTTMIDNVPEEFWSGRLSLKVLIERLKAEDSDFWPYLQTLPLGVPGIPLFYSEQAIRSLEYPPLIAQIKKRCRWLVHVSREDGPRLSQLAGNDDFVPDANLLGWALAAVSSRAFRVRGNSQPAAMLPLIDLCNHSFDPNCEVVPSTSTSGVDLVTSRNIPSGDALLINYGNLGNDDLLLDYGFLVMENPHDCVQLAFNPDSIAAQITAGTKHKERLVNGGSEVLKKWQRLTLGKLKFIGPGAEQFVRIVPGSDPVDPRFIAGVRILSSRTAPQSVSLERLGSFEFPLPVAEELTALRTIATMIVMALGQFSTDVESDETTLQTVEALDPNQRLAVAFRVEKKQILSNALRCVADNLRKMST